MESASTPTQGSSNKTALGPQSKAQTLDQVILEQKANSQSFASLFGSPKNLSGKSTTRFRLIGSTIQLENKLQARSVSAGQLDVTIRPVAEQERAQAVPETTNGTSTTTSTRSASASKLRSKRKLFGEDNAVTSASETTKIVDESIDKSSIEESFSIQGSSEVNSSISEMDLTLQHQSVDASLNQSLLMSPNSSILDDSLTSPNHTSKLNLSQLNLGSPTFKNKRTDADPLNSTLVSKSPKDVNSNANSNGTAVKDTQAAPSSVQQPATSVEIQKSQQPSSNGNGSTDEVAAIEQQDGADSAQSTAESKLKVRSKSLTELFTQSQLSTIIAAPPKPAVVPAGTYIYLFVLLESRSNTTRF